MEIVQVETETGRGTAETVEIAETETEKGIANGIEKETGTETGIETAETEIEIGTETVETAETETAIVTGMPGTLGTLGTCAMIGIAIETQGKIETETDIAVAGMIGIVHSVQPTLILQIILRKSEDQI